MNSKMKEDLDSLDLAITLFRRLRRKRIRSGDASFQCPTGFQLLGRPGTSGYVVCRKNSEFAIKVYNDYPWKNERDVLRKLSRQESNKVCKIFYVSKLHLSQVKVSCMERYDQNLDEFLEDEKRPHVLEWVCAQILLAAEWMEKVGVIHGDLKPANILVKHEPGTRIALCDFSSSWCLENSHEIDPQTGTTITQAAPELWFYENGYLNDATAASDRWSVACVCFEVYHGRRPWNPMLKLMYSNDRPPVSANVSGLICLEAKPILLALGIRSQEISCMHGLSQMTWAKLTEGKPVSMEARAPMFLHTVWSAFVQYEQNRKSFKEVRTSVGTQWEDVPSINEQPSHSSSPGAPGCK